LVEVILLYVLTSRQIADIEIRKITIFSLNLLLVVVDAYDDGRGLKVPEILLVLEKDEWILGLEG